jgi:glutathione S-transferase
LEASRGRFLPESGAIFWYLAGLSPLAPDNRIDRAETLQWMFFEQHSLEPYVGAAHFWLNLVKGGRQLQVHAVEDWMENGYRALGVMEKHLMTHQFFAADRYTIADISLYGYTHIANMRIRPHRVSCHRSLWHLQVGNCNYTLDVSQSLPGRFRVRSVG